ncbi:alanine racemase [Mesorhizobium sp. NBSH29]|uniref:alanine racemase n=1 Tax=Mesorhizobium sp. NBSH29 TaxID=2654249 RepID=UPI001896636B|nr:alanine racemase [Mesorhizobium sp. NBSH29]QPC85927.1 alanine racemase [Mesorhizobium sp. NBSH29]
MVDRDCDPENLAGAVLTIDLGAIRANYRQLARLAGGVQKCAGVVKADAYGIGAEKVAPALSAEGCSTFFVAHISEGIALRGILGSSAHIYVLNGVPPGGEAEAIAHDLRPVINSLEQLAAWRQAALRVGNVCAAALQVDSGMARLGMAPKEVEHIAADHAALAGISITLIMSHLACADEPGHPANAQQRNNFDILRSKLPQTPISLANSAGIFLGKDYLYDLVRPGIALYGGNPVPGWANPMQPVVGLQARVIQTRPVAARDGIGYGHAFLAHEPLTTATISLGYADGWPRRVGGSAFYHGTRLPFVGRVSMDSIILDISALPPETLHAGDLVDLIGVDQSVDEIASLAGTISYEILTGLGQRYHRRYLGA